MAETLLILMAAAAVLAAVYGVTRWAAWMERRAEERRLSERVYYPNRGENAHRQVPARRRQQAGGDNGAASDDLQRR